MEKIRKYFENELKLTDKDWHFFSSKLVRVELPKKHLILKAGQTEKFLSFIEEGIVRFCIPKIDGDLTFSFIFSNGFMSAYDSFLTQQPSTYNIETLTKTTIWRISYDDLQIIYKVTEQ